jgi:hypothetical protein
MRNSMTFLVAITVVFTGFVSACSKKDKFKAAAEQTPAEKSSEPVPAETAVKENNLIGYWVNATDKDDVLKIELSKDDETEKFETRLYGFNMKTYSGLPTTIWSGVAAGKDFDGAEIDRPLVKVISPTEASASISNDFVRNGESRSVTVNIQINQGDKDHLLVTVRSSGNGTVTLDHYERLPLEEGTKRFNEVARLRSRELARLYNDSKDDTNCNKDIAVVISQMDMVCLHKVADNSKVTEENLTMAVDSLDFTMVKYLLARYDGSTDALLAHLLGDNQPLPARQINDGKYYSLSLDVRPIMELLMPKAGDAKTVKANLTVILSRISNMPESQLIIADLNKLCGEDAVKNAASELAKLE